jgi:hypothetical protein
MNKKSQKIQQFRKRMDERAKKLYGEENPHRTNTSQYGGTEGTDNSNYLYLLWIGFAIIIALISGGTVLLI